MTGFSIWNLWVGKLRNSVYYALHCTDWDIVNANYKRLYENIVELEPRSQENLVGVFGW